ncbi:MAG: GAF domain-containing protein [Vicinamibacteria bacterium]|nr:GAF domain-containing protein [Vicinamibacteria bacterium]
MENERLRTRIAFFETSRGENERRLEAAEKRAELADALRALAGSLESEKVCVQQQLREAHDELDRYRKERADLEARLLSAEERNQRMERECGEAVAQSSNLANLYVASCRLHDTLDRAAVLAAIQEIIINLVGSEQIGIFELDGDQDMLSLIDSNGINPARFAGLRVKSGPIGRTACSGEIYVSDDAKEATPTACIPLKVDGRVVGVIAVFQLLSHKPALVPLDHEIFELLAAQAGAALYCTKLHLKERKASEQRCETERCE